MQDKGKNFKFLDSHRRLHKAFITINCQNSLIIHTYITILHLFSRKSGGDGRLALVLENLLPITINPSMIKLHQLSKPKGINLVVMDGNKELFLCLIVEHIWETIILWNIL